MLRRGLEITTSACSVTRDEDICRHTLSLSTTCFIVDIYFNQNITLGILGTLCQLKAQCFDTYMAYHYYLL